MVLKLMLQCCSFIMQPACNDLNLSTNLHGILGGGHLGTNAAGYFAFCVCCKSVNFSLLPSYFPLLICNKCLLRESDKDLR